MRTLFYKLPKNIAECFWGYNFILHLLAIAITYVLVTSGFDWYYFTSTRGTILYSFLFPAVILGGLLPVLVPLAILAVGKMRGSLKTINTAWALGQAALIGLLISSFYKAFTGRVQPEHVNSTVNFLSKTFIGRIQPTHIDVAIDISREFRFGFLRGGIFWGWPSSHTTVAFAMAVTLLMLYPKNKMAGYLALLYALYVGLGVSISIHWFSEFIAGALIGTVIGVVAGKSFRERYSV